LVTALTGPISELEQRMLDATPAIERWFRLEWMEHTPLFYCAITVRNAGFKLAAVSNDLHPGGWDLLTPPMWPLAVQSAMVAIEKICPEAKNLLVVPVNGLHSAAQVRSLQQLQRILYRAGLHVRLGSIDPDIKTSRSIESPDGEPLALEPVLRQGARIGLPDFNPCTILLNNDLGAGIPGILEDLQQQYLLPPLHASAALRRRSQHALAYEELSKRLGKLLGIDPWLIYPLYAACKPEAAFWRDELQTQVDAVLSRTRRKYKEYGIHEKPFVVLKAEGRGGTLHTLRDAAEVAILLPDPELPPEERPAFFIQEGLLTNECVGSCAAEPVVYVVDRFVVGGYYRTHAQRGADASLLGPDSGHAPLSFAEATMPPPPGHKLGASAPNRFYMYGVTARLAMLAASYELEASNPEPQESY